MPYTYEFGLESERLITRKLTKNDIPAWAEFFDDEEATRFLGSAEGMSGMQRATHMINRQLQRYEMERYGLQVILEKRTNSFLGLCGLLAQDVEGKREVEVGYHFFKKYWGQGYAPEAAKLFFDYAFDESQAESVVSIIDIENFKSQRVAEKNGLSIEKEIKWIDDEAVFIYRMKKTDWKR